MARLWKLPRKLALWPLLRDPTLRSQTPMPVPRLLKLWTLLRWASVADQSQPGLPQSTGGGPLAGP